MCCTVQGCLKISTFWPKRQKLGLSLSGKKAKVGTLTFWQKGKSLGYPTPDRAGFVEPHEPKKCISRTEHASALIWFGLLG